MKHNTAFSVESISYHLKLLNSITQVPMAVLTKNGATDKSFPFDECGIQFALSPSIIPSLFKSAEEIPFFDIDNQSTAYSLIPVDDNKTLYIFVGPAKLKRVIDPIVYHRNSLLFNETSFSVCKAIIPMLPVMNLFDFIYILQLMYYEMKNVKLSTEQFFNCNTDSAAIGAASRILFTRREASVYHHTYIGELQMCDVIRNGQVDRLPEAARFAEKGVPGVIHPDPLRNAKDLGIITITILVRPAIQGGLNDEIAFAMSDAYMREIEASNDSKEIFSICFRAASEYTHAVAGLKKKSNFSYHVVRCMDYLQKHLHERIIPSDISDYLHVSLKQLSASFKKETGLSITDYIQRERINEAKNLLAYTDLNFSEISNCLNYCSQSYFNSNFKKITGVTPAKYRKEHYKVPIFDGNFSIAAYIEESVQRKNPPFDFSNIAKNLSNNISVP